MYKPPNIQWSDIDIPVLNTLSSMYGTVKTASGVTCQTMSTDKKTQLKKTLRVIQCFKMGFCNFLMNTTSSYKNRKRNQFCNVESEELQRSYLEALNRKIITCNANDKRKKGNKKIKAIIVGLNI